MMQTILAHYETGNGLEPINLFTVLYMLRKHQNATVRLLCDHHAGFVQAQDKDEKDQVRRAIANQIARAERNLLVEKDPAQQPPGEAGHGLRECLAGDHPGEHRRGAARQTKKGLRSKQGTCTVHSHAPQPLGHPCL